MPTIGFRELFHLQKSKLKTSFQSGVCSFCPQRIGQNCLWQPSKPPFELSKMRLNAKVFRSLRRATKGFAFGNRNFLKKIE